MRLVVVVWSLMLVLASMAAAAEDVVIRSAVSPEEAWVGQRARLTVDVLGPDGWAQITDVADVQIDGTYILRTESQGTRLSESIGRTSYTGQRYEVSLFCQRPGRVDVPEIPVSVVVKQWGLGATDTRYELVTPTTSFLCKVPPGAEGIRNLISTTRLTASQTWSSEPDTVALGDAITRTVTLSADDVSAMAFPPMRHSEPAGTGIYPGEPSVTDRTERGRLSGERVETVTYVFEQPGPVALPGIVLPWWNLRTGSLERIELPGLELVVVGEPAIAADDEAVATTAAGIRDRWPWVLVGLALVGIGIALGRRLACRLADWRQARRESEATHFRQIAPALRSGDSAAVFAAIMSWLDRLDLEARPARLDDFLRRHGDEKARSAAAMLVRSLGSRESFGEAGHLGKGLGRARDRYRRARKQAKAVAGVLPELN